MVLPAPAVGQVNCTENGPDISGAPVVPTAGSEGTGTVVSEIHPAVQEKLQWFECAHLPTELAAISVQFRDLAYCLARTLTGPQLTIGLQHLLEAKDCAVRARKAMG